MAWVACTKCAQPKCPRRRDEGIAMTGKKKTKAKRGRPTTFKEATGQAIIERMAGGAICGDDHMPHEATVRGWVLDGGELDESDSRHAFSTKYARAEQMRAMKWAEEIVDIADDAINDWMERRNEDGEVSAVVADHEHISRSKLRVDTRKWIAAKMLPKVYGDKMKIDAAHMTLSHEAPLALRMASKFLNTASVCALMSPLPITWVS